MKNYKLVNTHPVARFYYKGGHSHPVRRTILIVESNDTHITGYEVRVGDIVRQPNAAPVKSYKRDKIWKTKHPKITQGSNYFAIGKTKKKSTLKRTPLYDYLFTGP